MRPPMTASKNDGVPPLHHHRKTQLGQKEVLAENQRKIRIQPLQQQQQQQQQNIEKHFQQIQLEQFQSLHQNQFQQQHQQQKKQKRTQSSSSSSSSTLFSSESDDFLCFKAQSNKFNEFLAKREKSEINPNGNSIVSPTSCQIAHYRTSCRKSISSNENLIDDGEILANGEDDDIYADPDNIDDGIDIDNEQLNTINSGSGKLFNKNSNLKRVSSDVSGSVLNNSTNSKYFAISEKTNIRKDINCSLDSVSVKNNSISYNSLEEIPKGLFVNNFENFVDYYQYQHLQQSQQDQSLVNSDWKEFTPSVVDRVVLPLSETEPLLTATNTVTTDPGSSICLNKNSASLIFTKKDLSKSKSSDSNSANNLSSLAHRRNGGNLNLGAKYKRSNSVASNSKNSLLQHRRSLQLNYSTIGRETVTCGGGDAGGFGSGSCGGCSGTRVCNSAGNGNGFGSECGNGSCSANAGSGTNHRTITTAVNNQKQYSNSWYDPVYSALEEEFEQESRDSSPVHKVANTKKTNCTGNEILETSSLLGRNSTNIHPQLHHTRIRRQTNCSSLTSPANSGGGGGGGNGVGLVGVGIGSGGVVVGTGNVLQSSSPSNDSDSVQHATSLLSAPHPKCRRFGSVFKSLFNRKPSKEANNNPPLLPSPEIKINPSASDHSLFRENFNISEKIYNSTASLNSVQQKLWNVVPLLRREGSCTSLHHEKSNPLVQYSGLRKCETVLALSKSSVTVEPIRPMNRFRNSSSTSNANCSRCSSLLSLAASGSRYSLNLANSGFVSVNGIPSSRTAPTTPGVGVSASMDTSSIHAIRSSIVKLNAAKPTVEIRETVSGAVAVPQSTRVESFMCKLCLADVKTNAASTIGECGCMFCTECMAAYIEYEISAGAYEISCPDAQCSSEGILSLIEIASLASTTSMNKHHRYRLNREIELDKTRTWCPKAGCETICVVGTSPLASSSSADKVNLITQVLCAVQCPSCKEEFCSGCKKPWHASITCDENSRRLAAEGQDDIGIPFDNDLIKYCPMCAVPIEKDEGCAQMMCKRCKHVFCWYCLASLDDDFLLRHYDKGPCKNKLGHSRASVVWHRAQVIGIFAGFGILLLVASPLLLLAAPCIICCKCRICNGSAKMDDTDTDFDEAVALQR